MNAAEKFRSSPQEFARNGYRLIPDYISPERCNSVLADIGAFTANNVLPHISRRSGDRPLNYSVIDGDKIGDNLPSVMQIFRDVGETVRSATGLHLSPLDDRKVACNINITSKGGTYRWHYDRNAVTAILYLNSVEGGETECYPNYRVRSGAFQQPLDSLLRNRIVRGTFGKKIAIAPAPGRLLIMRGDRCLHSVRPVTGGTDRVNIIMSFDVPGRKFAVADDLNQYLYESAHERTGDPNYPDRS